ncbi:Nudix hydrolase 1 [Trichoplax sp. H2]|nr:Nudix hydrolase 1 [Trichoplax sp. H2]|eukprot:RDD37671.1 Nudix hydrolase 1 [Trichoplax sp. H2]
MEPHRCEGWQWNSWDNFPQPSFIPIKIAKEHGYHPFKNTKGLE